MRSSPHYDSDYWEYQRAIGAIGAELNLWKFEPYLGVASTVVDFGCGGGFLLQRLNCERRIGIEPSESARLHAAELGLEVHPSPASIPDSIADVVISNHALEHTLRPLDELTDLRRILKPGGRLVIVVPVDDWRTQRRADPTDPNHHLYTWTPLLLGHLLSEAGFVVERCGVVHHAWLPSLLPIKRHAPPSAYRAATWLVAMLKRARQLHAVAQKP